MARAEAEDERRAKGVVEVKEMKKKKKNRKEREKKMGEKEKTVTNSPGNGASRRAAPTFSWNM